MKEITYVWHDPTEIPEREGQYLVTTLVGSVCIASYGKYRELENYNYIDGKKKYSAEEYVDCELEPVSTGWYSEIEHYDDMDGTCFYDLGCDPGDIVAWTEFPAPYKKEEEHRKTQNYSDDTPIDFMEQADIIVDASSAEVSSITKDDAVRYVNDRLNEIFKEGENIPYNFLNYII